MQVLQTLLNLIIVPDEKQHHKYCCINLKILQIQTEAVVQRCSIKQVFLKIWQNSQENTCARVSFLIKLQAEAQAQVFSCEFCEFFKNICFHKKPTVAASVQTNFTYQNMNACVCVNDRRKSSCSHKFCEPLFGKFVEIFSNPFQ